MSCGCLSTAKSRRQGVLHLSASALPALAALQLRHRRAWDARWAKQARDVEVHAAPGRVRGDSRIRTSRPSRRHGLGSREPRRSRPPESLKGSPAHFFRTAIVLTRQLSIAGRCLGSSQAGCATATCGVKPSRPLSTASLPGGFSDTGPLLDPAPRSSPAPARCRRAQKRKDLRSETDSDEACLRTLHGTNADRKSVV